MRIISHRKYGQQILFTKNLLTKEIIPIFALQYHSITGRKDDNVFITYYFANPYFA